MSTLKRVILNVIGPQLLISARIFEVHAPSETFRFVEIEAEAFKATKLSPGGKVQINVGKWDLRTYTPISLNTETGRLGILAYLHSQGPGSRWAENVKAGAPCQLLGPRPALKRPERPFVFFGDESAIATAASLQRQLPPRLSTGFVLEATDPVKVSGIVRDLGLKNTQVVPKTKDGRVPDAVLRSISKAAAQTEQVILAGRAQSIRQVRDRLREEDFPLSRVVSKAYWSEGRSGLD